MPVRWGVSETAEGGDSVKEGRSGVERLMWVLSVQLLIYVLFSILFH